jgi:hypothetical protein
MCTILEISLSEWDRERENTREDRCRENRVGSSLKGVRNEASLASALYTFLEI